MNLKLENSAIIGYKSKDFWASLRPQRLKILTTPLIEHNQDLESKLTTL